MEEQIKLTQYSKGAGCGCKISPQVLQQMLGEHRSMDKFPALLIGNRENDDAAVFQLNPEQALISTADFFMPIVDDAFDFGRVAAANSISDVYAMGGKPIMAIAILGWPIEKLPAALAGRVLDGARMVCEEAGIPLAGGHTVESAEPFFGLSVNGLIHSKQIKTNHGAQVGDLIYLTKPIGLGVLSTAQKRNEIQSEHVQAWMETLIQLNKFGEILGQQSYVTAMTDVTGFGLLGHAHEMAKGSGVTAELDYTSIPVLNGVKAYIAKRIIPDATYRNWNSYQADVSFEKGVNVMEAFSLLPDPQTNGGLLFSVSPKDQHLAEALMFEHGLENMAKPIGRMVAQAEKRIRVMP
jgi:selenide,water dikinase